MDIQIAWNNTPGLIEGSKGQDAWILCSECSEPITKARPGIVLMDVAHPLPSDASVSFVHKGTCDDGNNAWQDIDAFLGKLQLGI